MLRPSPERTLLEKLALLHNIATRFENDEITVEKEIMAAGRHYYDIKFLLEDHRVLEALKILFNGEIPTFAECLETVKVPRDLIYPSPGEAIPVPEDLLNAWR